MPRVGELPFDSDRKRMTTVHARPTRRRRATRLLEVLRSLDAPYIAFTKGAVDGLLAFDVARLDRRPARADDDDWRGASWPPTRSSRRNGMRVLGVAFRAPARRRPPTGDIGARSDLRRPGRHDRPAARRGEGRGGAAAAAAGIRPVMITGDHPLTAAAIARELGIAHRRHARDRRGARHAGRGGARARRSSDVSVFARVSPEHKLRIVEALQQQGQIVAMTGDGVNDAPALKQADIGVAMGITGTDVSKEAADMVLRDDNFATIVAAVEEGRVIYDNLRRFVKFAVAGNIGKVAGDAALADSVRAAGTPLDRPSRCCRCSCCGSTC